MRKIHTEKNYPKSATQYERKKKKQLKTSFFSLDSLTISNVSDRMWEFPKLNTHEM